MRVILPLILLFVFPLFAFAADNRPNILFIFTDDHAYQAISAYGSNRNETPNIDRLAAEGMRFTQCCVTNSICGPSRAVIQTGKYSHLNGFKTNDDKFDNTQQTFPKLLQNAGYQTAVVGKWHLECDATPGYDYSEVLVGQGPYYNPIMIRNGKRVQHAGHTTQIITDLSLEWLDKRDKSKPFLLMTQHKAPHREWEAYPKYYEQYKETVFPYPETFDDNYSGRGRAALEQDMSIAETMSLRDVKVNTPQPFLDSLTDEQRAGWEKMYGGRKAEFEAVKNDPVALKRWKYQCYMKDYMSCVAAVDDGIGQMLKYLDDHDLAKNTIVVYASDQGFYLGEHGWFDKRFMYNESFKTPLIVRWPGHTQSGSVNHDIVSNLDFAETFLDVAGVAIPADMQGRSLIPVLEGKTPTDWRKSFYYHYYEYPAVHMVKKHEGVYDGRFKLIHFYDDIDEWELYDLEKDPNEMCNVYANPENAQEITRLTAELERLKMELKVPPTTINTVSEVFDKPLEGRLWLQHLRNVIEKRKAAITQTWNVRDYIPLNEFIVGSHRGAGHLTAENSLEAFEIAWNLGTIPEADIKTTKDGVIVAFHDGNFRRILPNASDEMKNKTIADLTLAELKQLDIGAWKGSEHEGQRIPALAEIVGVLKKVPKRKMYFDLKHVNFEQLADETKEVHPQLVIATQNHGQLQHWKRLAPTSQTQLWTRGTEEKLTEQFDQLEKNRFDSVDQLVILMDTDASGKFLLSDDFLRQTGERLRKYNVLFQILPWENRHKTGGSNAEVYKRLMNLGVAGFATDYPDVTMQAVREYYAEKNDPPRKNKVE